MPGMRFNKEEMILMMLYNPGSRLGLMEELRRMQTALTGRERKLRSLTAKVLDKLERITDAEFDALPLYPEIDLEEGGCDGIEA